jgi:GAF domain-containing protein
MEGELESYSRLSETLCAIREMLNMDIIFISEFIKNERTFRYVDARSIHGPIKVGESAPLDEGFCLRIVDGRLPQVIQDSSMLPAALEITATRRLGIRAHLSVPIVLRSGEVFGTLCCFSQTEPAARAEDDATTLQAVADFIASGTDGRGFFKARAWPGLSSYS